jgi:hypothetical protein
MRAALLVLAPAPALWLSPGSVSPARARTATSAAVAAAERSAPVPAPAPTLAASSVPTPGALHPPAHLQVVEANGRAGVDTMRQPSARSVLALIGAAVVVIALVAPLR